MKELNFPKAEHTLYVTVTEKHNGDMFQEHPTFNRSEAYRYGRTMINHLTEKELNSRDIYIVGYHVDDSITDADECFRAIVDANLTGDEFINDL